MIQRIAVGKRSICLVGTAHVSEKSVEDVREAIETYKPDTVCVELDERRYKNLTDGNRWQNTDIVSVIKKKQGMYMIASLILSAFQQRIGSSATPGAEMIEAIRITKEKNIALALCDRPVDKTLIRAWRKTGFFAKFKLLEVLFSAAFSTKKLEAHEIEAIKDQSAIDSMMQELSEYLPSLRAVLIDERDRYLAKKIFDIPGKNIVAVVGLGHLNGIVEHLHALQKKESDIDCTALETLPPVSRIGKVLKWILPILILGLITRGAFQSDWQRVVNNALIWVVINASFTGIAAIIALAHPLTILGSVIAAPFTSLNPAIGVGFVAGVLEGNFRKPLVRDFQTVTKDVKSLRGVYRNRVSKVLLVFILTTIGSAIGTFGAIPALLG